MISDFILAGRESSVSVARYIVTACLPGWDRNLVDTAVLLTSEVVTNAVVHPVPARTLSLVRLRVAPLEYLRALRVEVTDRGAAGTLPSVQHVGVTAEHGRGLALVEALSAAWGADVNDTTTTVWFELRTA